MADALTEGDLRDLICLTMVPGVGPHTSQALLERFKTAGQALDASIAELRGAGGRAEARREDRAGAARA